MRRKVHVSSRSELFRVIGAVVALLVLHAALTAALVRNRHAYERAQDRVTVAVDGKEVAAAARRTAVPPAQFLRQLRDAGATAVAVYEYTLQEAVDDGRAFLVSPEAFEALLRAAGRAAGQPDVAAPIRSVRATEPGDDPAEYARFLFGVELNSADPWFADALAARLPEDFELVYRHESLMIWRFPRTLPLADVSLGFDPGDFAAAREAGLDVVPRLRPAGKRSLDEIKTTIDQLQGEPVAAFVFWGAEVTGYPHALGEVARFLAPFGAPVGLVEFAAQRGLSELAKALDYRAVRVHSITAEEMQAGVRREVAERRWERAVRERGVRLAYVRLYPEATLTESADYLRAVAARLESAGFKPGRPAVQEAPAPGRSPLWVLLVAALSAGASGLWLLRLAVPQRVDTRLAAVAAAAALLPCAAFLLLWMKGYTVIARQLVAGVAAVIYPALGVLAGLKCARGVAGSIGGAGRRRGEDFVRDGLVPALGGFAAAIAVTLAGAMAVVAALDDVRFLLKIEEFRGVKAAYLAPLAVVAAAMLFDALSPGAARRPGGAESAKGGAQEGEEAGGPFQGLARRLARWLGTPVKLGHVLLAAGLLAILAVYVLRSGNQGLPVFGLEAALRAFLEDSFPARPRTKEFLIGHPALMAAFALAAPAGRRGGLLAAAVPLLLVLGTVGAVSVINTFAHAHSPLALSAIRTGYGLLIGVPFGIALAAVLWRIAGTLAAGSGRAPGRPRRAFRTLSGPGTGA